MSFLSFRECEMTFGFLWTWFSISVCLHKGLWMRGEMKEGLFFLESDRRRVGNVPSPVPRLQNPRTHPRHKIRSRKYAVRGWVGSTQVKLPKIKAAGPRTQTEWLRVGGGRCWIKRWWITVPWALEMEVCLKIAVLSTTWLDGGRGALGGIGSWGCNQSVPRAPPAELNVQWGAAGVVSPGGGRRPSSRNYSDHGWWVFFHRTLFRGSTHRPSEREKKRWWKNKEILNQQNKTPMN